MAIIDRKSTRLTIWDIREEHLEYEEQFSESDMISDLDWTCTPDSQSILAVGFQTEFLSTANCDLITRKSFQLGHHLERLISLRKSIFAYSYLKNSP